MLSPEVVKSRLARDRPN